MTAPHEDGGALERARKGDLRALESLVVEHLPALEAYVRLKLGARIRAKESIRDVVQSICVEVLRDEAEFEYRGEGPFRAWLFRHALHKIVNKNVFWGRGRRDVAKELQPLDGGSSSGPQVPLAELYATMGTPSEALAAKEAEARFESAFAKLPPDYQDAITLHRLAGLSHAEIAAEMGRSEGAVRNLVHRGLARLSLLLDEVDEAESG